jgi:hypothetical protein
LIFGWASAIIPGIDRPTCGQELVVSITWGTIILKRRQSRVSDEIAGLQRDFTVGQIADDVVA